MTMDTGYTKDQVNDIVNAHVLSLRLETIEKRNHDNWKQFREHTEKEDKTIVDIYERITAIDEKMADGRLVVQECKSELEEKVRAQYITKDQLDLSLTKMGETISKGLGERFESFANRMDARLSKAEEETKANRQLIDRITYIIIGLSMAAAAIEWIAQLAANGVTAMGGK